MTKKCNICKKYLDIGAFNKNQYKCRSCSHKWASENHPKRLEKALIKQQKFKGITYTICTRCKQEKSVHCFAKSRYKETGYRHHCRGCESLKHKERSFGLTEEHLKIMLLAQRNSCRICGISNNASPLVVDHCHKTEGIRGLLCRKCNSGIGLLGDQVEQLQKAIDYLNEFEEYHKRPKVLKLGG